MRSTPWLYSGVSIVALHAAHHQRRLCERSELAMIAAATGAGATLSDVARPGRDGYARRRCPPRCQPALVCVVDARVDDQAVRIEFEHFDGAFARVASRRYSITTVRGPPVIAIGVKCTSSICFRSGSASCGACDWACPGAVRAARGAVPPPRYVPANSRGPQYAPGCPVRSARPVHTTSRAPATRAEIGIHRGRSGRRLRLETSRGIPLPGTRPESHAAQQQSLAWPADCV